MNLQITVEVWKKGNWYLAKTPELDFVTQGKTPEEAKRNLFEVIAIQLKEMKEMNTLDEYLSECGFETREGCFVSLSEMIGFEKSVVPVA